MVREINTGFVRNRRESQRLVDLECGKLSRINYDLSPKYTIYNSRWHTLIARARFSSASLIVLKFNRELHIL